MVHTLLDLQCLCQRLVSAGKIQWAMSNSLALMESFFRVRLGMKCQASRSDTRALLAIATSCFSLVSVQRCEEKQHVGECRILISLALALLEAISNIRG